MIFQFISRKDANKMTQNGGDRDLVAIHHLFGLYFFLKGLTSHDPSFFFASKSNYKKVVKDSGLIMDKLWSIDEAIKFIAKFSSYNEVQILLHLWPIEDFLSLDMKKSYGVSEYRKFITETPAIFISSTAHPGSLLLH